MTRPTATTQCAVLGSPIAHSLSPTLHRAAYRHLNLAWDYERFEVDAPALRGFLDGLDETWRGLSLTMPLKQAAIDCVDDVSEIARRTGSVNTILLSDGRRSGDNTDVVGIVEALRERGATPAATASVLGAGATARSALAALHELADSVTVYVRTPDRAAALHGTARSLGLAIDIAPWAARRDALHAPLVVSTTPAGATDDLAPFVDDPAGTGSVGVLLDVVYAPWPTALAHAWSSAGGAVAGGVDLLVHQAVRQVELMTGRTVPADVLRQAAAAELAARARPDHS